MGAVVTASVLSALPFILVCEYSRVAGSGHLKGGELLRGMESRLDI
jgi:hypothetical protein